MKIDSDILYAIDSMSYAFEAYCNFEKFKERPDTMDDRVGLP